MTCPHCGLSHPAGTLACNECGASTSPAWCEVEYLDSGRTPCRVYALDPRLVVDVAGRPHLRFPDGHLRDMLAWNAACRAEVYVEAARAPALARGSR